MNFKFQISLGEAESLFSGQPNFKLKPGNAWIGIILLLTFLVTLGIALVSDAVVTIAQSKKATQTLVAQSLCDAGIEKAVFKLNDSGGSYAGEDDLDMETGLIDITVTNIDSENKNIVVTAYVPDKTNPIQQRTVRAKVTAEANESAVAFNYGVQVGSAGVTMSNNAILSGNLYASGNLSCQNNAQITGDAFLSRNLAGNYGSMNGCRVNGNAEANNITNSTITGWGKYVTSKAGSTAAGGLTQISQNQLDLDVPYVGLPLSQNTIDSWKTWAAEGGTYSGNYTVDGSTQTLGPKKIDGNLTVTNGGTLTITGVLWVTGNLNFSNNAIIKLAPSFGPNSGMIVVDSPTDPDAYGKVNVSNNVSIQGSGNASSYIMILSTNTGDTTANQAINVGNNSTAVVYYATVGMVEVSNNARLRAVSGGGLYLSNGAQVQYDSGMASTNFSGGPGGSWEVSEWQIIH
jgi:hypothetical protein